MSGTVNVHVADLDEVAQADVLSDDERIRADRYRYSVDRERYVAGRTFLRSTLARYFSADPASIRFRYGANGKPAIEVSGSPLHFNLSHSRNVAILGVAGTPVGVDVEHVDSLRDLDDISRVVLSPVERSFVLAGHGRDRLHRFFRYWTLKEAVAKADGSGAAEAVNEVEVAWDGEGARLVRFGNHPIQTWSLFTPHIDEGVCVAIAVRHDNARIEMKEWRAADG